MPASITQGTQTVSFPHDVNHQRVKQITANGNTLYINAFGVTAELFGAGTAAARWTEYLMVGNVRVGMRVTDIATSTTSLRYFHTDHLGSVAVITNEAAVVVERLSYDAWGKRRYPNGADDPTGSITSQTSRGFTGHEELDSVALVHMNGRLYDALMGRMISADPTVPDPMNAQAWNRYSYVGNDPLAFTDPSGFSWLSNFFHSVANFFRNNPIFRAIAQLAITAALIVAINIPIIGPIIAAAASAAIVTGLSGGNLGQMLRAGAIAGATAFAFSMVGDITLGPAHASPAFDSPDFNFGNYAGNVAGHALVGCASSAASGGSCKSGALAAAVSAAALPAMSGMNGPQKLVASAVLGGVGSVAGGGKFANGAITGAFGYLFNACGADPNGCMKWGASIGTALGIVTSAGCDAGTALACSVANPAIVAGMAAAGAATGAAADAAFNASGSYVHGNSLDSLRVTYVYELVDRSTEEIVKYGITSEVNPYSRYTAADYLAMNARMEFLGSYETRWMARSEELRLTGNYVIENGRFPRYTWRW
jgi:RHS repeat-associated protein